MGDTVALVSIIKAGARTGGPYMMRVALQVCFDRCEFASKSDEIAT